MKHRVVRNVRAVLAKTPPGLRRAARRRILPVLPAPIGSAVRRAVGSGGVGRPIDLMRLPRPGLERLRDSLDMGFGEAAVAGLELALEEEEAGSPRWRAETLLRLGRHHLEVDDHQRALRTLDAFWLMEPEDADLRIDATLLHADVLLARDDARGAREALRRQDGERYGAEALVRWAQAASGSGTSRSELARERAAILSQLLIHRRYAPLTASEAASDDGEVVIQVSCTREELDPSPAEGTGARVAVIVPVDDIDRHVRSTVRSVLDQTWPDVEVLVVVGASLASSGVELGFDDPRLQVLEASEPRPSAAASIRLALERTDAPYVTVAAVGDRLHAQVLAGCVQRLLDDDARQVSVPAGLTADEALLPKPVPGQRGRRIAPAPVNAVYRRGAVEALGAHFDVPLRFAAAEYLDRASARFGDDAIDRFEPAVPLVLHRPPSPGSPEAEPGTHALSWTAVFHDISRQWHASQDFISSLPASEDHLAHQLVVLPASGGDGPSAYDVVIMADFSTPGGTTLSNIEEVKTLARAGFAVALLHHPTYRWRRLPINPKMLAAARSLGVPFLTQRTPATCALLIVRKPVVAERLLPDLPLREVAQVALLVNQTPARTYPPVEPKDVMFELGTSVRSLVARFGPAVVSYPIGPVVREALLEHHQASLKGITVSDEDWFNAIDPSEWGPAGGYESGSPHVPFRIGRHSRDHRTKWPFDAREIESAYPDDPRYEVRLLGGSTAVEELLGYRPRNWTVLEFDGVPVPEFLASLDVFVYITHPDSHEAFGRVFIEAMASGTPVVTERRYERLLGDGALYVDAAEEIPALLEVLRTDEDAYRAQVRRGEEAVRARFGPDVLVQRVSALLGR